MRPVRAEWGRAEWGRLGLSGVGEGLGMHWDSIKLPREAGSGGVGPVRAEWGWSGVGHALGFN